MIRPPPRSTLFPSTSLFRSLPEVRLVYVSPRPTQFETARKTFLAAAGRPPKKDPGEEILRYFRSEEHTSELQSQSNLVCRLLLEKKKETSHLGCDHI